VSKAINTDDPELRAYYFRQAGFHQAYNYGEFGNTKTPLQIQTRRRVGDRAGLLGFYIRDNSDFMDQEFD
jgi:hypothetical protein